MSGLLEQLLALASPWGYVLVGLLAAGEAAAFIGLIVPGETAMLLGGVLVATGHAELGWMITAGIMGAVTGDSIGYELGRRFGAPLQRSRLGSRVGPQRWQRAEAYVRDRGGKAVLLGRWIGVLRALVPFVAGASRMPYRVFLPYNIAGGAPWAAAFVAAGFLAGNSYQRVERAAGRASLVLGILVVLIVAVIVAARWVTKHPDTILRPVRNVARSERAQHFASRYRRQITFVADRLRPRGAFGLVLTVQLIVLVTAGAAFGGVVEDVLRGNELIGLDSPISRFLITRREPWLTTPMHVITWLGSATVLIPLALAVGIWAARRQKSRRPVIFLAIALGGSTIVVQLIKLLVARPRPSGGIISAMGYSFPSGHATAAAAGWGALLLLLIPLARRWGVRVTMATTATLIVLLVGISRVYLGVHAPTDVLGGWALGAAWVTATTAATCVLDENGTHGHTKA